MTALATLYPAVGEGQMLSPDLVESVLTAAGVINGIEWETISEACLEVNTSRRAKLDVVVARGTDPHPARPAFYRVLESTKQAQPALQEERGGRVDYKSVSRLPVVHAGQLIGRLVPAEEGADGVDVLGTEIAFPTTAVDALRPGKNTKEVNSLVYATIGGQLRVADGQFYVEDRLEIGGDVGYETGSIEFPGDVILKGEVREGFHIWAGGGIESKSTVDVSEIYCRKDFITTGGLVGRGRALLRSGGRIQARFIGNCYVESKGAIFAKQYIYQSHVGCLDRIAMGNRGKIVGGTLVALTGIRCFAAGNEANVPTVIRVGTDFIVERRLRLVKERMEQVSAKLRKLQERLPADPSDRQLDVLTRLEAGRMSLAEQLADLAGKLDANEDAEVIVDGTVHPGVTIQICRASHTVTTTQTKVRFTLNKDTGLVKAQPLDGEK